MRREPRLTFCRCLAVPTGVTRRAVVLLRRALPVAIALTPTVAAAADAGPASTAPTPPPERDGLSLRVSGGLGGGSVGFALRAGAELEYWVLPTLALGLQGALGSQSALFGDQSSSWFVGPGLVLRDSPDGTSVFASAAMGTAGGEFSRSTGNLLCEVDCYESRSLHGFAVALGFGVMGRVGGMDIGGVLAVDIPLLRGGDSLTAVTGNLVLGFSLPAP